jgi:tetratricopeptide (TPR) repeat protein
MTRESVAFAVSGVCFGLLAGWVIGSQQGRAVTPPSVAPPVADESAGGAPPPAALDAARAAALERQATAEPANASVRTELGRLYLDARQFDRAIDWYDAALKINPKDANALSELALAYSSTNQVDRALEHLDRALAADPKSVKAWFYQGIVRAVGKDDLQGAAESWQRVIAIAPNSEEARRAQQGLDGIAAAHASGPGERAGPEGAAP